MKNFIISLLVTLLVMATTQVTRDSSVKNDPPRIKRQSIIQPLEAKAYAQKQEMVKVPVQAPKASPVASTTVSGTWVEKCHAWASQAGISLNASAIKLLERESHCNPLARNPTSSAGGIAQALPWTKMGCPLSIEGAPCQLKWFQGYVMGRYGSYEKALAHSYAVGWY